MDRAMAITAKVASFTPRNRRAGSDPVRVIDDQLGELALTSTPVPDQTTRVSRRRDVEGRLWPTTTRLVS